ncbi:hypothetical protein [Hydrogenophaga sp. 5NK40-0174]|uniref:hypothetical protein n=1 Tax=Hydrogenophaga sp. 5NK40-0174 TaxID=3127649 RepID=UPI003107ED38
MSSSHLFRGVAAQCVRAAGLSLALLGASSLLWAAEREGAQEAGPDRVAIDAQYHADRLRCSKIDDAASRQACLKEAGAARQESIRGNFPEATGDAQLHRRNALQRCAVHKDPLLRQACERMVLGDGTAKGSVESGGVYKEMTITLDPVPIPAGSPPSQR